MKARASDAEEAAVAEIIVLALKKRQPSYAQLSTEPRALAPTSTRTPHADTADDSTERGASLNKSVQFSSGANFFSWPPLHHKMLRRLALIAACVASASAFTAPAGITRASGALVNVESAFATKSALPIAAPTQRTNALDSLKMSCTTARTMKTRQQPHRKECMLLKKIANNAMSVSFSHRRHHKQQHVNLQWKRVWWEEGNSHVKLRISTKAIKTLKTKTLAELAARVSLDLNKYKSG